MTREDISEGIGNISTGYIQEALNYKVLPQKKPFFKTPFRRFGIVVALALWLMVGGISAFSFFNRMTVTAYAYGTDEEITENEAIISTGTINDNGEMVGHPLMFYLSGKDISTVRFSCKNQQISFMDWTEKRDEYGLAQNFTVSYGEDESEYYYLLIDWVPNATIRELTDNETSTISTLPDELRNDVIVMEINFQNGKTVTKAITISLLDDGTFSAVFNDYKISDNDKFVNRPDSETIPRDVLYKQGGGRDADQNEMEAAKLVVEAYYEDTVLEIVSMEVKEQTSDEISFSVCVSKEGVIQEPNRTIWLRLVNEKWKVVNEGY